MQVNESIMDRVLRAIGGVVVLYFSYMAFTGWIQIVGYVVAVVLIFTAITGFCALYKVFGINTNKGH